MGLFYITPDNNLRAVSDDGSDDRAISKAGQVFQVSGTDNAENEQVWIISSDPDTDSAIGGDIIKVSVLDTSGTPVFSDFVTPGGKTLGARSIAAGKNSCYFVEGDGSVHQVDKDGNQSQVFPANTAIQINKGADGLIIVLSYDINVEQGGNIIKWFKEGDTSLSGATDGAVGSQCAGQMNGISYIKPNGDFCNFSPYSAPGGDFAVDGNPVKLITNSSQYLAITDEVHADGGNLIQNISQPGPTTIKTAKGAVYAEGTSGNYDLFN